jgi:hypothetical protein
MWTPSSALAGALLVSGCILEPEPMFVAKNLDLNSYKKILNNICLICLQPFDHQN